MEYQRRPRKKTWLHLFRKASFVWCFFQVGLFLWAIDLSIGPEDLRIEQRVDGGYHLFIRKKPDIGSVLLTESTRDPSGRADNYAYRAKDWNPINGDEIRYLDGKPIPPESKIYSLIDSTPEADSQFGEAFHIYIPYILIYGYPWTRQGEVYVVDGTYLNIRAFAKPYGDYTGPFKDNPFVVRVVQKPLEGPPEGNYMKDTVESFTSIAAAGKGEVRFSTGGEDIVPVIRKILESAQGESLDLVIALDTTASMQNDIDAVRRMLIPMLQEILSRFKGFRIGMVLYKDYFEDYLTKVIPFTSDFALFQRNLNAIRVGGGRDIPEAVYEALYDGLTQFPWSAEERMIILIGDAPPHPRPRGKITQEMVESKAQHLEVRLNVIILPQ
ncbi:vWA domain-containing protein [Treponema sp. J25]|uniref:vWA domain-containing protein n=1 Tax=Treponema sp. J25 TaxID=2094121 RepID=UPI00104F2516|nr:vWA domain-containing protein [Treponema sp. J25]TCW61611.1 hypothetical protein C5O22_05960 [Treponema sp. J25]